MRRSVFVALTTVLFGCNAILGIEEGTPEPDDASGSSTGSSGSTGVGGASSGSGTSAASTGAGGSQSTGAAGATGSGVGGSTGAGGNVGAGGSTGASGSGGSAGAGGGPTGSGGAAGASGGGGKAGTAGTGGALRDAASDGALVDASKDTGSVVDAAFDGNDGRCFVAIAYVVPGGAGARTGCSIADAAPSVAVALPSVNNQGTVRVAEGIYTGQSITIDRAVSVDGGWDVTFALHDAATHPTILRGAPTVLTVSGAAITSQTTISGLNIQADSAGRAVVVTASADPILVGNIIAGGNGGGGDSEAIYIDGGAAPILRANYLRGGVGSSYSIGVRVASSGGAVLIERNRIEAGYSPSNSAGLQLQGPAVMLANNLVFGGNAALQTRAIETAGNPTFVNNTLHGGTGDSSTGIYGQGSPIIVNNLVLAPGASFGTCIALVPNGPRTLFNNLLFTCTHALYDNNGANITSIATVNGLNGKDVPDGTCAPTVNCQHAKFAGNVTTAVPPASIFTNITGADSVLATLGDNDWHLATTDPAITQGGHNAALADCGTMETPASCGAVTVDHAGAARSDPYSIGAYEK